VSDGAPALAVVAQIAMLVALAALGVWLGARLRRRRARAPVAPAVETGVERFSRAPAEQPAAREEDAPVSWDRGGPPLERRLGGLPRVEVADRAAAGV
jgi:hypothetical protein